MNKYLLLPILFIVGILAVAFVFIPVGELHWKTVRTRDIYYVELPIGRFWTDIEGRFVFGCGSIDTKLSESYNIKYFKDGELRSITLDAYDTAIIADGNFYLEVRVHCGKSIFGVESLTGVEYTAIHIPSLPQLNETLKWNIP